MQFSINDAIVSVHVAEVCEVAELRRDGARKLIPVESPIEATKEDIMINIDQLNMDGSE